MNWEDERWVKLYTRDSITWKLWGWQARFVMMSLMRKVDRAGVVDVAGRGINGLAALLEIPPDIVRDGLAQLTEPDDDGERTVVWDGPQLVISRFIEAQEAHTSNAQRQRDSRERRRDFAKRGIVRDDDVGVVYFARADDGTIKIGFSTDAPARIESVSNGRGHDVVPLAWFKGTRDDERATQERFRPARLRGEWFRPVAGLLKLIDAVGFGRMSAAEVALCDCDGLDDVRVTNSVTTIALPADAEVVTPRVDKGRRKRRVTSEDAENVLAHFARHYHHANGQKPSRPARKLVDRLQALIDDHGLHEVRTRITRAFDSPPSWPPPPYDLAAIVQHFDRFTAVRRAANVGRFEPTDGLDYSSPWSSNTATDNRMPWEDE